LRASSLTVSSVRISGNAAGSNSASTILPRVSIRRPIRLAKSSGNAWAWSASVIMVSILCFS